MTNEEYKLYCRMWNEYLSWPNSGRCIFIATKSPYKTVYSEAPTNWPSVSIEFDSPEKFTLAMVEFSGPIKTALSVYVGPITSNINPLLTTPSASLYHDGTSNNLTMRGIESER